MKVVMMRRSACRCRVGALQGKAWSALATWAPPAAGTGRCDRVEEEEEEKEEGEEEKEEEEGKEGEEEGKGSTK